MAVEIIQGRKMRTHVKVAATALMAMLVGCVTVQPASGSAGQDLMADQAFSMGLPPLARAYVSKGDRIRVVGEVACKQGTCRLVTLPDPAAAMLRFVVTPDGHFAGKAINPMGAKMGMPYRPTPPVRLVEYAPAAGSALAEDAPEAAPPAIAFRTASSEEIEQIRGYLQTKLKDSDSAKFLNVVVETFDPGEVKVGARFCGQLNSKNSWGAYGGYSFFSGTFISAGEKRSIILFDLDDNDESAAAVRCMQSKLVTEGEG